MNYQLLLAHQVREFGILELDDMSSPRTRLIGEVIVDPLDVGSCDRVVELAWMSSALEKLDNGSVTDSKSSRLAADSWILDLFRMRDVLEVSTVESGFNTVPLLLLAD